MEVSFLNRGCQKNMIRSLFVPLFGSWCYCPYCFKMLHTQTALMTHLNKCGNQKRPLKNEEIGSFVKQPERYSIKVGTDYHCPLCEFLHSDLEQVLKHMIDRDNHSSKQLCLLGLHRYLLKPDDRVDTVCNTIQTFWKETLQDVNMPEYPEALRRHDVETLAQFDRVSQECTLYPQLPLEDSYFELILSEAAFIRKSYTTDQEEKFKEFYR